MLEKRIAFALHVLFFIFFTTSVFWLSWQWVLLIFILLRLQDFLVGGCILTYLEFGTFKRQWIKSHLVKSNILPGWIFALLIDWLFPASLVMITYLLQK